MTSALYAGVVTHARFRPMRHQLRYTMIQGLFALEALPGLGARLRLFGHNRRALVSFHDKDHGDGSGDLQGWVRGLLAQAGIAAAGPISVLCMPRMLGFAFNPLSLFFCRDDTGALKAIVYQVNNTFGQRHAYVAPVAGEGVVRQTAKKAFHVSPFLPMDLDYAFAVTPPGDQVAVKIDVSDGEGPVLNAVFAGQRRDLDDRELARALLAFPFMTFKVVAGIHWEALKLWVKGARYHDVPEQGPKVTIGSPRSG